MWRKRAHPELEHRRARGIDHAPPEALPELHVAGDGEVVAEAHPSLGREEGVLVEEGEPDGVGHRVEDEGPDQEERRQEAEDSERWLGEPTAHPPRGSRRYSLSPA